MTDDAAELGADARFDGSGGVVVVAEPIALKRLFVNLVENALKFGGSARVGLAVADAEAVVSVDDDGPGVPEAEFEKIFEPFQRGEPSRSRETGGSGLGLAVARAIARAHGGEVTLANRPEGGLRATVCLPLTRSAG